MDSWSLSTMVHGFRGSPRSIFKSFLNVGGYDGCISRQRLPVDPVSSKIQQLYQSIDCTVVNIGNQHLLEGLA
ncbi:hypothetical protein CRYUN_Cryun26dG0012400 [Craigia yunnanensis]